MGMMEVNLLSRKYFIDQGKEARKGLFSLSKKSVFSAFIEQNSYLTYTPYQDYKGYDQTSTRNNTVYANGFYITDRGHTLSPFSYRI